MDVPDHRSVACALAFEPVGRRLVVATRGGVERLSWPGLEVVDAQCAPTGYRNARRLLAISPAGDQIAISGWGASVAIATPDGRVARPLPRPTGRASGATGVGRDRFWSDDVCDFRFAPDGTLWSIHSDGTVFRFDPCNGACAVVGRTIVDQAETVLVLPTRQAAVSSGRGVHPSTLALCDLRTGQVSTVAPPPSRDWRGGRPIALAANEAADAILVSCTGPHAAILRVGDSARVESVVTLERHPASPTPLMKQPGRTMAHAFHPKEPALVAVNVAGDLLQYDTRTGRLTAAVPRAFPSGYSNRSEYWLHRAELAVEPDPSDGRLRVAHRNRRGPSRGLPRGAEVVAVNGQRIRGVLALVRAIDSSPNDAELLIKTTDESGRTFRLDLSVSSYDGSATATPQAS